MYNTKTKRGTNKSKIRLPAAPNQSKKSKVKTPNKSIKRKLPHNEKSTFSKEFKWNGPRKCKHCDQIEEKRGNMKNHSLNHYKDKLNSITPPASLVLPFPCPEPECYGKEHRDKVTFQRHFGFGHRKIYQFCTEEDLLGEEIIGEGNSSTSDNSVTTGATAPQSSGSESKKLKTNKIKEEMITVDVNPGLHEFSENILPLTNSSSISEANLSEPPILNIVALNEHT